MKKQIFIIGLALLLSTPAYAELTVSDTVSRDYLKNHGYSDANINVIRKSIARANGEPLAEPTEREIYKNPCVKFIREVFMYIDPALDDHKFGSDYDIKPTTRFDSL